MSRRVWTISLLLAIAIAAIGGMCVVRSRELRTSEANRKRVNVFALAILYCLDGEPPEVGEDEKQAVRAISSRKGALQLVEASVGSKQDWRRDLYGSWIVVRHLKSKAFAIYSVGEDKRDGTDDDVWCHVDPASMVITQGRGAAEWERSWGVE